MGLREKMTIKYKKAILISIISLILPCLLFSQEKSETESQNKQNLLTLNLRDVPIEDALKIISEASGLNIVLDKDVKAVVNVNLKDVPWSVAMENILKSNELTFKTQGNIIRVMTLASIKKEEETIPLVTRILTLNFAKIEDLKTSLAKMLSQRGSLEINVPTNSLIISDVPDVVAKIEEVATTLDIRTPQVIIEALIVSIKLSETDKIGIDWTATHKERPERQISQSLLAPDSTLDIYYGKTILPKWNFDAQLALYAQDKRVEILANPRVLTLDNLPAQIEIMEQVPYTYTSSSTQGGTVTSTQFKDIGIKLNVTPHITSKDNFIYLSVNAEQSFVAALVGATNEPSIDSRKAETNLMLKDSDTVVIGGLRKKDNTLTTDKVPFFGDIPFIGKLFRKEIKEIADTELLIFITPHIVKDLMSAEEANKLEKSRSQLFSKELIEGSQKSRSSVITEALDKAAAARPALKETK